MWQANATFDLPQVKCQAAPMKHLPLLAPLAFATSAIAAPPTVTAENFESLHALLQPTTEETKWQQIQWRTSLWQARVDAAVAGKPIYLWEMDGHPLGCT